MNKLWTKNFTIITLGSIISMLGNTVSEFALGLLVFDNTQSPLLYSLFLLICMLPTVLLPSLVGPYLDRFPRRKVIFMLDYIYGAIFTLIAIMTYFNYFNYIIFMIIGFLVGIIGCIYNVAYESFYPELISEGNYSKAYSISSLIWPIANTLMVPIAAWVLLNYGLFPLFFFNAVTFFITATFETQIKIDEQHVKTSSSKGYDKKTFTRDFKEGYKYLIKEKALIAITSYFFVSMFSQGVTNSILLPFFETTPGRNVSQYALIMGFMSAGRMVGGLIHYFFRYPVKRKYSIAVFVYSISSILEMTIYLFPYNAIIPIVFLNGMLSVTSFNIRTSATQSYVPSEMRGRFNGTFMMLTTLGMVIGQLVGGILGEFIHLPYIAIATLSLNVIAVYFCIARSKESVKLLYNREV